MFNLATIVSLLGKVGPVVAALPEFKQTFDSIVGTFKEKDQEVLKKTYADLMAENDEGFERLDRKLGEAEQR